MGPKAYSAPRVARGSFVTQTARAGNHRDFTLGKRRSAPMQGPDTRAVVVVEDDVSMRQAMERILRLAQLRAMAFGSAEELLESGLEENAMCLIIDVQLPGLSGFALRDRLASQRRLPPVIFISAFDEPDARDQAASVKAAFLTKPFSGRTLLEAIRHVGDPAPAALAKGVRP
jgi:FixJ family two-component response regulator